MTSRMGVQVAVATAAALVAGACSGADAGGYERADKILSSAGVETPAVGESSDIEELDGGAVECSVEVREDEYGMTFEVCVADDPAPAAEIEVEVAGAQQIRPVTRAERSPETDVLPAQRFDELVSALPEGPAAVAMADVGLALQSMDNSCGESPEAWAGSIPALNEVLLAAVSPVTELSDYRDTPDARELARSLIERVALQTGCERPAVRAGPVGGIGLSGLLATASSLTAAAEPLYQALWGSDKSPYFYHPDELVHRRWMQAEGQVDVVVVGTSQALLGIEPDLLAEQLGLRVGNVALPGAVAEVQQYWLPEVMVAASPDTVLWGFGPLDLVSACRPDGRADEFRRLAILKNDLLAPFSWADDAAPLARLLGENADSPHDTTPTGVTALTRFRQPLGDAFEFANADPVELSASLERFRAPFERSDFCADRLVLVGQIIAELEADGRRVVMFGMPLAPELAATYDGGAAALQALVDEAATNVFEPAGAEYLGMMNSIEAAGGGFWYDVVHPTRSGGAELSAEVAAALLLLDES